MHPVLFHFGHVLLPTFGVCTAVGLMLGFSLSLKTSRLLGLDADAVWNAGLFAVVAAFVPSRVLPAVAHFGSFRRFPLLLLAVPSLTAPGLVLAACAVAAWVHLHRLPMLRLLDAWAAPAALVWGFLALGHLAAGSDPGMPTSSALGLAFPGETTRLHPVALYVAVFAFALAYVLWRMLAHPARTCHVAAAGLMAAGTAQFLFTFLRQPLRAAVGGLDGLQVVSLGMIVAGAFLLILPVPHDPP